MHWLWLETLLKFCGGFDLSFCVTFERFRFKVLGLFLKKIASSTSSVHLLNYRHFQTQKKFLHLVSINFCPFGHFASKVVIGLLFDKILLYFRFSFMVFHFHFPFMFLNSIITFVLVISNQFFAIKPLQFVLLIHFIQILLQVQECLITCYKVEPIEDFQFHIPKDKIVFQTMLNSLMFD